MVNTESEATKNIIRVSHPTAPLSVYNHKLAGALRKRSHAALKEVLAITEEIKANKIKFDQVTYNALLIAYTRAGQSDKAIATLKEMIDQAIKPTVDSFNIILDSLATYKDACSKQEALVEMMKEQSVELTPMSYQHLVRGATSANDLAKVKQWLDSMKTLHVDPTLLTFNYAVHCCFENADADTALQCLSEAEALQLPVGTEPRMLMDLVRVTAINDKTEAMVAMWEKTVNKYGLRPDEGTCLQVLRLSGKTGNTAMASEVIRQLSNNGYPYKEHYFIPLMEAFVVKGDLKNAFHVLDIMRTSGVEPTKRSTFAISVQLSENVDHIDKAYYLLEEIKKEGNNVDVAAFNMVVQACGLAKDIGRTVATYREAEQLGVTPNTDTFNAVLDACYLAKMKGMGQVVIQELKKSNVTPNSDTYAKMIAITCDQRDYEEVFVYLEEMKSKGMTPPRLTYNILANRLARARDPRFHLVLEEMETFGYKPSANLKSQW
ncbi:hypothetical protein DM01DRAFT_1287819 [Hesseltinella vesiculosa]|uniref:Pentatricopeptide repeat-containing protein-mitochondrial domain-containing protein n=1 Tax=Hesseltinella vesiculosa TaxID=101127 RepID=A0A1X2GH60_9FUNG|nr:hypothetical protein DM01DRAFT_1287819 [Hesseltinella vesiculosa]